jgi:hypothetical protein
MLTEDRFKIIDHNREVLKKLDHWWKLSNACDKLIGIDLRVNYFEDVVEEIKEFYRTHSFKDFRKVHNYGIVTHNKILQFLNLPAEEERKFTKKEQEAVDYLKSRGYKVVPWGRKAKPKTKA